MHTDETMHVQMQEHVYMICHQSHSDKVTILNLSGLCLRGLCMRESQNSLHVWTKRMQLKEKEIKITLLNEFLLSNKPCPYIHQTILFSILHFECHWVFLLHHLDTVAAPRIQVESIKDLSSASRINSFSPL